MNKITITEDELKKAVMEVVYGERCLCPSQQVYGITAQLWKLLSKETEGVVAQSG